MREARPTAIAQRETAGAPAQDAPRLWLPVPTPVPIPPRPPAVVGHRSRWTCFADGAGALKAAVQEWPPGLAGTVAVLPAEPTPPAMATLLQAAQHVAGTGERLVLIHAGVGGTSLLRTLCSEQQALSCLSIDVAPTRPALAAAAGVATTWQGTGVNELSVDAQGLATVDSWAAVPFPEGKPPLSPGDLVLVTGGLGGLGGSVARRLARRFGAHPVLLDRADPTLPGPRRVLEELRSAGLAFTHLTADVTDPVAVRSALEPLTSQRSVAAVVHCAGLIEGGRVGSLDTTRISRLFEPKVTGLRSVLAALDHRRLRVVVAFGSVLARRPHPGVGAYALANELLRREVERCAQRWPGPRYVTAEWSVWEGAGVAAETGATAVARQAGYSPVPLAEGLDTVERLLAWDASPSGVLVSARLPEGLVRATSEHELR